jgi:hypothetical protein
VSKIFKVHGYCPMGCGETLYLDGLACVRCDQPNCPRPDAADRILADPETEHLVTVAEDGYSMKHPLHERLDNALLSCALGAEIGELYQDVGDYLGMGTFRVVPTPPRGWTWTRP